MSDLCAYSRRIFRRYLLLQASVWVFLGGLVASVGSRIGEYPFGVRFAFWVAVSILFLVVSAAISVRFFTPLRRLLMKTQRMVDSPSGNAASSAVSEALNFESVAQDEAEWFEIEKAIDEVRDSLQQEGEALRREREELSTLMSAIGEAIVAADRQGKILFFNSQFALIAMATNQCRTLSLGFEF
jgi:PAS domain-containing protein